MIVLEGIVSRVRYSGRHREYTLSDGRSEHGFVCEDALQPGSAVRIEGEMGVEKIAAARVTILEGAKAEEAYAKARANVSASAAIPDKPLLFQDALTEAIWPSVKMAAIEILCAKRLGRSVMLRFHGDADGICGAFALTAVVMCKAFQQNSAVYSVREALRDIAAIGQESRPMVLLVDFGSGDGSAEGLSLLSAAGIDYLVIDHHPFNARDNKKIINPFGFAENASKYTAGYLACEVAACCGLDGGKALALAKTACAGDKSAILGSGPDDAKKAMVLDFLASHVSFGNNLDFYRKVMEKEELFASIARQADETIEEAAEKAMAKMKSTRAEGKGGLEIVSFPLEGIVKKGEWPPSSKVTTRVFDKLKERSGAPSSGLAGTPAGRGNAGTGSVPEQGDRPRAPLMCIGFTERSVIMRLNEDAGMLGLDANALAEKLKASMPDFVEGGGGHARAGAIRARPGFARDVLNELIRETSSIAASKAGK